MGSEMCIRDRDRTGLTNSELADFRVELVEVIQRYFEIDEHGFDIDYEREGDSTRLVINSPVIVRRQEAAGKMLGAEKVRAGKLAAKTGMKKEVANGVNSSPSTSASGSGGGSRLSRREKRKGKRRQNQAQKVQSSPATSS